MNFFQSECTKVLVLIGQHYTDPDELRADADRILYIVLFDGIVTTWRWILLLYPIVMLVFFNLGYGLILSALYVFFRDIQYLCTIFLQLLMYLSAILYDIATSPAKIQNLFLLNPVYLFILYFRKIVIDMAITDSRFHLLMLVETEAVIAVGAWMYKKYNNEFLYYI